MPEPPIVPQVPQVPVVQSVGDSLEAIRRAQQQKKSTAALRQQALQAYAQSKDPIFRRIYYKSIQRGSLSTFQYLHWKHDPYPLVLCSGIYQDGRIAGINLHYMTFKYIKYLIQQYCGKQFSYPLIKGNNYIYNAFRTYKKDGVRMTKLLDCNFLLTILGSLRSFNPTEIEAMRQEIQRQLRERMNPTVEETAKEYTETVAPDPRYQRYLDTEDYEAMERFGEPEWPRAVPKLNRLKPTIDDRRRRPLSTLQPPND